MSTAIEGMMLVKWRDAVLDPPEETEWVLCYGDGAIACRAYNAVRKCFEDWQTCKSPGLMMKEITLWMRLPKPPESNKE